MPILTFIAMGLVGFFAPTPQYPASRHVCASNLVPVGATVGIYYDKTHHGISCRVVGIIASKNGHVVDVSESVRYALGFKRETVVRLYRVLGSVPTCPGVKPKTHNCNVPPAACIANLPQTSLVVCVN